MANCCFIVSFANSVNIESIGVVALLIEVEAIACFVLSLMVMSISP